MAYQSVNPKENYFKYSECTDGQTLVEDGIYEGSREGKFGTQYKFRLGDGSRTVLNKSWVLDGLIEENVKVGDKCRIIYAGTKVSEKGDHKGKPYHNFDLAIDDDGGVEIRHVTGETVREPESIPGLSI